MNIILSILCRCTCVPIIQWEYDKIMHDYKFRIIIAKLFCDHEIRSYVEIYAYYNILRDEMKHVLKKKMHVGK